MRGSHQPRVGPSLVIAALLALACSPPPTTVPQSTAPQTTAPQTTAPQTAASQATAPGVSPAAPPPAEPIAAGAPLDPFFDELEKRTFAFFWERTNPGNGLVPDRWPTPSFSSIAAVGFGLTAYPIGAERGYVTRAEARDRVLATLRFLATAPSGPEPRGRTGYKGFFYHFLDMATGERFETVELSTIDTSLLLAGALFCQSYFDRDEPEEREIRDLAERLYTAADWTWFQARAPLISMGWVPERGPGERGLLAYDWIGYNEAMIVYLLALGSPTHPIEPAAWEAWASTYDRTWGTFHGYEYLAFAPLFGHQYSHLWVDFRGLQDAFTRERGLDYFKNSRRAAYAHRAYAVANPMGWKGYGENVWGLSACDGPLDATLSYAGERRRFWTYAARGASPNDTRDDGTIAPTAAAASIPFAPEIAIPAVLEMHRRYGEHVFGTYGFLDAFNPSFDFEVPIQHGRVIPGFGWVDGDYLGIDQGPILAMLENYRSGLVWETMKRNRHLRRGLQRAGFTGGWLEEPLTPALSPQAGRGGQRAP